MANSGKGSSILDIYQNKSKLKWIVLAMSTIISVGSIYYTNYLVDKLKQRESKLIELFARTLEYTIEDELSVNLLFITREILIPNNEIPVILTNANDSIISWRNIRGLKDSYSEPKRRGILKSELELMKETYDPIVITDKDENGEVFSFQLVYYRNSFLLTQLTYYPYIQLSVIAIFGFIAYLAFNYSKTAEQNRVWVGLAKETAHQLGTPLSSLMAWLEYLKEEPSLKEKGITEELDKDIQKLKMITERFSNIGSTPALKDENVHDIISNIINYLKPRLSSKVSFNINSLSPGITAKINAPLFEWVIENLCKNAVDAMSGAGSISIRILRGSDNRVIVDITDTGKGIPKSKIKQVFNPGFTTKKGGWGLGLTLVKRIIEIYHEGKIFVRSSEENQGTTFRIILSVG
ncbi:MAG: HAMP domain-containing sensor histidine kinase [Bacteroidota bacterium]